jgi:hypothetical protein
MKAFFSSNKYESVLHIWARTVLYVSRAQCSAFVM